MNGAEFARAVSPAPSPEARLTWFGALLCRESGTGVEIVGGSAIEIYLTSAEYVSDDVDLVGEKALIAAVLRRWGFRAIEGRSRRVYWSKKNIGLVDVVGPGDRSGLPPRQVKTPFGPVLLSAVEPLIVRRLWRSAREGSADLFEQAVKLARNRDLDWEYLEAEARFEGVASSLVDLRKSVRPTTRGRRGPDEKAQDRTRGS